MRGLVVAACALPLVGCVTREVREVPVPIRPPTLCVTDCPAPEGIPQTTGELALQWRERGEVIECYRARMQCVREVAQ